MIPDSLIEEKLGFSQVRSLVESYCLGIPGKEWVANVHFSNDYEWILKEISLTAEFRLMLISKPGFPAEEYTDLRQDLLKLRTPGTFPSIESMVLLRFSYFFYSDCLGFIETLSIAEYPLLHELIGGCFSNPKINSEINRIVDEKGEIRDHASPELYTIRKKIISHKQQVDKRIAALLTQAKLQKWVNQDVEIAVRNGRLVIPVPAGNKRKLNGVIHDESATGQTFYVEPTEVFELNNDIRELELAEKREIIRILTAFADFLRPDLDELIHIYELLGRIDFIRAKALFALSIGASKPLLGRGQGFNWYDARHPLLYLAHSKQNKPVVPLDIQLDNDNRILIISGPNAGGKSVCLKTVGLLQYMLQCGMLVPMKETSDTGVFSQLFIDIGDQQSIEDDLSTYSSHLSNIRKLLLSANPGTLFLIDEFGSGTEPQTGGAIAEAVLEKLNEKGAYGVVTTHYANLKLLAQHGNGFTNGAMLFDTREMRPLFRLKIGKPGSSFAFEIAGNIQFPKEVLDRAGEKLGQAKLDFDRQVQELDNERAEILMKEKQLKKADETLNGIILKYQSLSDELEQKKKEIIEKARQDARELLDKTNRIIENTVREIRQSQADKTKTREVRKSLKEFEDVLDKETILQLTPAPDPEPIAPVTEKIAADAFRLGDSVTMDGQRETGEIIELSSHDAVVAFRTVKLRVSLDQLALIKKGNNNHSPIARKSVSYQNMLNDMNARMANFRLSIDVRGYRAEEALGLIQKYIDECIMLRVNEVSILHGKGNGILRGAIRNYLQSIQEVLNYSDEKLEMGGAGITIVKFKH